MKGLRKLFRNTGKTTSSRTENGYSRYLEAKEIEVRQCVYINKETHGKIKRIVRTLSDGMTIGCYIDNVLKEHIELHRDEINARLRNSSSYLL